jgi:hypothetical protein
MSRGIRIVGEAISAYTADPSWDVSSQSFTICGWAEVLGTATTAWGHSPFGTKETGGNPVIYLGTDVADANSGTSWQIDCWDNLSNQLAGPTWAVGDVRFFAVVWDSGTGTYSYYSALDGAVSLTDHGDQVTGSTGTVGEIHIGWSGWGGEANNHECTNVKAWTKTLDEAGLLAEMKSEAVVDSGSVYAHWKLLNVSDTTDQTGNGHTLTIDGGIVSGDMVVSDFGGQTISPTGIASAASVGSPSFEHTATTDLRPTGDGTIAGGWTTTGVNYWTEIDDDPDSPVTADYVAGSGGSSFFLLTDMPADFSAMRTASVKVHLRGDNLTPVDGAVTLYAQLVQSDESTPLSDEATVSVQTDENWETASVELAGIVAGNDTTWDGARLKLRVV